MNIITADDLRPDIRAYLEGWFEKASARQIGKGKRFLLSFGEFLTLWGKRRIRSLEQWMDDGSLYVRQRKHTPEAPNLNGYVLSYVSFAASQSGSMTPENAQICTRGKSLMDCRMGKGDKHSEKSKARISASKAGVALSEKHRGNISASMTGMKRGPMSQADKDKRAASVRATLAAKRVNASSNPLAANLLG